MLIHRNALLGAGLLDSIKYHTNSRPSSDIGLNSNMTRTTAGHFAHRADAQGYL